MEKDNICLIELKRTYRGAEYTIGHLYIDGKYVCDSLEDTDRGLSDDMPLEHIKELKKFCETAIPTGVYHVSMDIMSPKYHKKYPRLLNVKGYEGVLIHSGNDKDDTCGCILTGFNTVKGKVTHSREAFNKVYEKLKKARNDGRAIIIKID